ncbi:helix-turn-helix domain-containing protein [Methylogaea oryzae]|uniref:HTH cro/C1-type domain-containing protein n=1 Tax=Methylogaea oryzae TaxID=1295382 RepID=A0A8D4VKD6_9GAMM|nr:helix-turn-helix transcriptional regulator [Methylogaea oryzae]BBL69713.1 hypothetical protein MoryE10_03190 [Methylogaea oryzae]
MSTFGERLRKERQRLEMNQTQFAALAGVQKQAQINYEAGKRSPDADYLAAIAAAGADVQYILTGRRVAVPVAAGVEDAPAIPAIAHPPADYAVQRRDLAERRLQLYRMGSNLALGVLHGYGATPAPRQMLGMGELLWTMAEVAAADGQSDERYSDALLAQLEDALRDLGYRRRR